jgi:molecular chaperone GrpE (heat shock protein)
VQEIVSKFLTREQTYNQLLNAVSENENKSDRLREEHECLASKLHELQMEHEGENDAQVGKKKREDGTPFSPEIDSLDKTIISLTKEKDKSDELCKKVELVNDQVQSWCSKVVQKIDSQFDENIGAHDGKKTLAFMFE